MTYPFSNLDVPMDSFIPRRPSPRIEDMLHSPRKAQRTRQRLPEHHTFDDAVDLLNNSSNIVVLTGAGISTSVGIPDFRSAKGLYNKLSKIGITQPEDFFSMTYFRENPEDFFKYVREVVPTAVPSLGGGYRSVQGSHKEKDDASDSVEIPQFTPTHAFLALLQSKGRLLTNYTQNIDGLERAAGVPPDQYIQCHGSWDTATCLTCGKSSSAKKYLPVVHSGNVPFCKCFNEVPTARRQPKKKKDNAKTGAKRKRAKSFSDHSSDDGTKPLEAPRGLLKPDLVFFEEKITPQYHSRLESDRAKVDLLIIIGTSLKVAPIQYMLFKIRPDVPQIYISKERFNGAQCSLPGVQVDIELLGECDIIIEELCRRAGWRASLERRLWRSGQTKIRRAGPRMKVEQQHGASEMSRQEERFGTPDSNADVKDVPLGTHLATRLVSGLMETDSKTSTPEPEHRSDRVDTSKSKVKVELVEGTDHQWRITRITPK